MQYTPLNRVTSGPGHFDPIKRNKGVSPTNRSKLTLFIWFCLLPSDPINQLNPITQGLYEGEHTVYINITYLKNVRPTDAQTRKTFLHDVIIK